MEQKMKFFVHKTGGWVRYSIDSDPVRTEGWVLEYDSFDKVADVADRAQFKWMLDQGLQVTNAGEYTWQIRCS